MQKINYRTTYIILYMLVVIFSVFLVSYISNIKNTTNINEISSKKVEEKFLSHEKIIKEYINTHEKFLQSVARNSMLQNYINENKNKKELQELFLTLNDSLTDSFQLRYINKNGIEEIKVQKNLINNKYKSYIIKDDLLQNKSKRYYFDRFKSLIKDNIGFSKIDLYKEFDKKVNRKMASLRVATPVYNKKDIKTGFIVLSLNLNKLFDTLKESTLYDIYLIDDQKRFLMHPNKEYGILSNTFKSHLFEKELQTHKDNKYFSKKLSVLNTGQDLKLIFISKYQALQKQQKEEELSMYAILITLAFISLPIVFYFASVPDTLKGRISKQALTDALTQLPNRACLLHDLSKKKFEDCIIVIIHIDNYNKVHDAYGFKIAEELIKECSNFLKQFEYNNSFLKLYKISKASFAFKYQYERKEKLLSSLENIHYRLENEPFKVMNKEFEILTNATFGVSDTEKLNNNLDEIKEAELALSDALKDKVDINIYDNTEEKNIEINKKNILMVNKIKKAIENDNVIVQFQAIYDNNKNCINKYETLIRLKIDDKIVYPGEFLDIAKETKKYKKLTMIVIDKAFEYFKDKTDIQFSINLSIEDISDKKIRKHLFDRIKQYDIKDRLVLEIVETEAIDNYENFFFFIKKAKEYGCKIAIDDFGSGYSNYEYIVKLSDYIDFLKIDGSLIIGLDKNPKRQLLIGTLKFLCDNLNIQTIAEYVENEDLFNYVRSMGIDYSQGYYIGKSEDEIKVA